MYAGFVACDTYACVFYDTTSKKYKVCRCLIKSDIVFEEFENLRQLKEYYGDAFTPAEDIQIEFPESTQPFFQSEEEITIEGPIKYIGFIPGDPEKDFKCVFYDTKNKTILVCMVLEKGELSFKEYKNMKDFLHDYGDKFKDDMDKGISKELG
jgi:hypothetical protein